MLLNLVRMRYGDVPLFLQVSSVLTQYTYSGQVSAQGSFAVAGQDRPDATADTVGAGAAVQFVERPTVTYAPLSGEAFSRRLIAPLSNEIIFSLAQSGTPLEALVPIAVRRINGVRSLTNKVEYDDDDVSEFERFDRIAQLIRSLRSEASLEVRRTTDESELVLDLAKEQDTAGQIKELRELLGLDPTISEFRITTRTIGRGPNEITIEPRSLASIREFLSRGIDVPEEDSQSGYVIEGVAHEHITLPLHVSTSDEAPADAHVIVRYHGHYFFIEGDDLTSKRAFALLLYLFEIQAPSGGPTGPLLTLPT